MAQRPGRDGALDQRECAVDQEGECGDRQAGGDHAGGAVRGFVDDDVPETAPAGERRECGGRHDVDRRGPDAGEDEGQRERELDPPQHLHWVHAHRPCRLHGIWVDLADPDVRVREDHGRGKDDERGHHVDEADPEEADADRDDGEARQRSADVRHVDRKEREPVQVTEPHAERDRNQDGDSDRGERHLEVRHGLLADQAEVVEEEADGVAE
jgi:hypothetical protein